MTSPRRLGPSPGTGHGGVEPLASQPDPKRARPGSEVTILVGGDENRAVEEPAATRDAQSDVEEPEVAEEEQVEQAQVEAEAPLPSGQARAGQVATITLVNFMCHEHLTMDFGPNVTFISGSNGSGKSAALTALQCCLGARARDTGRFKSVHGFVKHGMPYALVSVTLCNEGPDAYRAEELGPRITIERRINSGTGGHIKIRDAQGRERMSGAKEVTALMDHFCINAANPVVVLTQDLARGFAGQASEGAKFQFFEEAMHFQEIGANLRLANERLECMLAANKGDEAGLQGAEADLGAKKSRLELLRGVEAWRATHVKLAKGLVWKAVAETEADIQEVERDLATTFPESAEQARADAKAACARKDELDVAISREEAKVNDLKEAIEGVTQTVQALRAKKAAGVQELSSARADLRRLEGELAGMRSEHQSMAEAISEVDGRGAAEQRARLERSGAAVRAAELEAEAACAAAAPRSFARRPIGPVGAALALNDDVWALAVECAIGRTLPNFLVHSHEDARALRTLMTRCNCRATVIVYNFDHPPHVVPAHLAAAPDVLTVERALVFPPGAEGSVLRNVLMDHQNIERITSVWSAGGHQAYLRGSNEVLTAPNRRLVPSLARDTSQAEAMAQQDLAEARAQLEQQRAEERRLASEAAACAALRHQAEAGMQQAREHLSQLEQGLADARTQAEAVREEAVAGENDSHAKRLAELAGDIASSAVQAEARRDAVARLEAAQAELEARWQEAQGAAPASARELEKAQTVIEDCARERALCHEKETEAWAHLDQVEQSSERAQAVLDQLEAVLIQQLASAERVCPLAEGEAALEALTREVGEGGGPNLGARGGDGRPGEATDSAVPDPTAADPLSTRALLAWLTQLSARIARREREAGAALGDLQLEVTRGERRLAAMRGAHARSDAMCSLLRASARERVKKLRRLQRSVATLLDRHFGSYLGMRGHAGSVTVDYETRRLRMEVHIAGGARVTDMNALSGGERSIATVCLIMAMGYVGQGAPFSCMDEFDVFMDAINRRVALQFLLEFAYKFQDRQFIYLTPQASATMQKALGMRARDLTALHEAEENLVATKKISLPPGFLRTVRMRAPRSEAS
ncbi:Structural maintenance of chromosomes protein 6 [Auxenochlorella protothecoides]|uniref:Structural maintenance of chromosomes protein 6 n=1 Tax=Auxenochlorella protothecoides TaxID=3075 RepID=A0A087SJH4_AUXPR|nr:Structural maintenance of chromosomes protein 6 [Auxenochlorella protothecoides]KFM25878.1 Structural maintenance of chromosomes protein 6 [Auxenochlorella protothecoides]